MPEIVQTDLKSAREVTHLAPAQSAANGIRYASFGDTQVSSSDLEQLVEAVPRAMAAALHTRTYYFVPLTLDESTDTGVGESGQDETRPEQITIAPEFSTQLADVAFCHRNVSLAEADCIFISTRLMQDRFALAFEFYINASHHFVDAVGVPESFMDLVWSQAEAGVRGETSHDAWESRGRAIGQTAMEQTTSRWNPPPARTRRIRSLQAAAAPAAPIQRNVIDEKARGEYFHATFADAIAIYLLSLTVDFDYIELREREYPLLVAPALAERLRHIARLFPPNQGNEFSIRYRHSNV